MDQTWHPVIFHRFGPGFVLFLVFKGNFSTNPRFFRISMGVPVIFETSKLLTVKEIDIDVKKPWFRKKNDRLEGLPYRESGGTEAASR